MPKYEVLKWSAVDKDGNRKQVGETVELSEDDARFYGDRLKRIKEYSGLPDDFPMRDTLIEAGYDKLPKVHGALDKELLAIDGIGDSRLLDIRNYGHTGNTNRS